MVSRKSATTVHSVKEINRYTVQCQGNQHAYSPQCQGTEHAYSPVSRKSTNNGPQCQGTEHAYSPVSIKEINGVKEPKASVSTHVQHTAVTEINMVNTWLLLLCH